jgi:hypothetical protein
VAIVTYDEHLAFLVKMEMGARAERYGFVDAKLPVPVTVLFGDDTYEQMRYRQGYEDGKMLLQQGGRP